MDVTQLKELCKEHDLTDMGNKADLIARLSAHRALRSHEREGAVGEIADRVGDRQWVPVGGWFCMLSVDFLLQQ